MRDRSWRRHQRERAIQRVLSNVKQNRDWWYSFCAGTPQPHKFWENKERINKYPASDIYILPSTWEEVFVSRLEIALSRHSVRTKCSCISCGNPRKWWGERTIKEKVAEINHYEQLEALGEEQLCQKPNIWRPRHHWKCHSNI